MGDARLPEQLDSECRAPSSVILEPGVAVLVDAHRGVDGADGAGGAGGAERIRRCGEVPTAVRRDDEAAVAEAGAAVARRGAAVAATEPVAPAPTAPTVAIPV